MCWSILVRYSGSYETHNGQTVQPTASVHPSSSLTAISSITKPSSLYDLKSHSSLMASDATDGAASQVNRNPNRDSMAQVEDNRVELERLVEKINQDLTSAKQATEKRSPMDDAKYRASIEVFLASSPQKSSQVEKTPAAAQNSVHSIAVSDDETLETLLAEVKDSPVTDLDNEVTTADVEPTETVFSQPKQNETKLRVTDANISMCAGKEEEMTLTSTITVEEIDSLEKEVDKIDDKLTLDLDEDKSESPRCTAENKASKENCIQTHVQPVKVHGASSGSKFN